MQTNGTLINEELIEVIVRNKIKVGVSLDGPPSMNDKTRVFPDGRGTSEEISHGISMLARHRENFGGILCVINLQSDPLEVYRYVRDFHPPSVDFLLPHGSYDGLPPGIFSRPEITKYSTWLEEIFEDWYPDDTAPSVRTFDSIIKMLFGGHSLVEALGLGCIDLVVIETNGDIEAVDTLKSCYQGAAVTGLSVLRNSFSEALMAPAIASRQMGIDSLSAVCQSCKFVQVCGGGYQPHRFSKENGFINPSIYCEALQHLIGHISQRVYEDLRRANASVPPPVQNLRRKD